MKTLLSWKQAADAAARVREAGGTVVTTNGCFDLLHRGHVSYLQEARSLGDLLIVGINADASVRRLKGPSRPLNTEEDRAAVLAALRCVDGVCVFSEDTPVEWLRTLRPQIHAKGGDWNGKELPEQAALKEWGGRLQFLPFVDGFSTTSLIAKSQGKT
jgi:D-beta-D-heptose 7-phosphate kinase/D-beta-D-heptose 1-phosphate adenosyltransferase